MYGFLERVIVWLLVVVLVGVALHTPATVLIETHWPALELLAKAWKELLLGAVLVLLLVVMYRRRLLGKLLSDNYLRLTAAIAVWHVVLLVWFDNAYVSELAGLLIDLRFYLFFAEMYVVARFIPELRRYGLRAAAIGAGIVIGFGALQAVVLPKDTLALLGYSDTTIKPYLTVDLNHDYIRINSTLRGPNPVGAFAVIVLCAVVAWGLRRRQQLRDMRIRVLLLGSILASLLVVWASYSRSAWAAAVAGIATLAASVVPKHAALYGLAGVLVAGVLGIGILLQLRDIPMVSNLVFHNNPTGGSAEKSDEGHIASLEHGIEAASQSPLGSGVGSTGSASLLADEPVIIENQYLFMAHESGWLGLGLQLVLFVLVLGGLWRSRRDWLSLGLCASGVGMALIGLLLPVWVDDTVSLYWWGLAGLALGSSGMIKANGTTNEQSRHQETKRTT